MTRYSELYQKEVGHRRALEVNMDRLREAHDRYVRFLKETDQVKEFMTWYAKELGLSDDLCDVVGNFVPPEIGA